MRTNRLSNCQRGFTLVELLVVIAIIAILAALLLPVLPKVIERTKIKKAQMEMGNIVQAIKLYESKYGRYPVSSGVLDAATASHSDFTYPDTLLQTILGPGNPTVNNSEIIAILMDIEKYPNTGLATADSGHVKNTQQIRFLEAKMVDSTTESGVGPDLVYRDPWGHPYVISIDLNFDEKCRDALYQKSSVSKQNNGSGYNGLVNSKDSTGASDEFEYHGSVMVWSLGPDGKADAGPAIDGANKDNILSWK